MNKICLITENPTEEKILEVSFPNRYGDYLEKLLNKAQIKPEERVIICSEDSLRESEFQVIVTLGRTPTGLLLKLPKSFKMGDYVGKQKGKIVPWYSLEHLFIKGKKLEQQTVELLGNIKCKLTST